MLNDNLSLMKGRLGVYDKNEYETSAVDGVNDQANRLRQHGGNLQQKRLIKDKRRSLERALWYSYQGADVRKVGQENSEPVRALINQDKLKQDYDDKILSIGYEHDFKPGDVFEWVGTNTHWIIYLQDLTELAYFRGDIRKCSYEIEWEDEDILYPMVKKKLSGDFERKSIDRCIRYFVYKGYGLEEIKSMIEKINAEEEYGI